MSGPWSTPKQTPPASSLRDVMSEQAAETPEDDELARALAESMKLAEEEKAKEWWTINSSLMSTVTTPNDLSLFWVSA